MGKDISLGFDENSDDDQIVEMQFQGDIEKPSYVVVPDKMINDEVLGTR